MPPLPVGPGQPGRPRPGTGKRHPQLAYALLQYERSLLDEKDREDTYPHPDDIIQALTTGMLLDAVLRIDESPASRSDGRSMMKKAELYIAYDHKRVALDADRKRIADGQAPPENFQELVDAVRAAHDAWQSAPD